MNPEDELRVAVVIPAYQAAKTVGRAVHSVLAQTRPPAEILVVDDGSKDDPRAALAPFENRVTLLHKPNGGAASARNLGIERARGDLIAFLDADDYWEPVKLERQIEVFHRHPEVGLVAGQFFEEIPGGLRVVPSPEAGELLDRVLELSGQEAFATAMRIWTGTVVVRRDVLGAERFVSGLEPAEDRDLWARLTAGSPVYLLSEPLATAVLEPGSMSRSNIDVDCANMLQVVRRHGALLGPRGVRHWEAITFRRWAANHLAQGRPQAALPLAWRRIRRQPFSPEGWWILLKCAALASSTAFLGGRSAARWI
jgi:glycosyltransferase involved in cell wall biosynthesis